MRKIEMKVAASMPPMTVVPKTRRETAPDPVAIASGTVPRMKAKAVMRIGRNRSLAPRECGLEERLAFLHIHPWRIQR